MSLRYLIFIFFSFSIDVCIDIFFEKCISRNFFTTDAFTRGIKVVPDTGRALAPDAQAS